MFSTLIAALLAAGAPAANTSEAASAPYADCILNHLQAGMSDRTALLVQQACAAKYPQSHAAAVQLEIALDRRRQAEFERTRDAAVKAANEAAAAAAQQANLDAAATHADVSRGN